MEEGIAELARVITEIANDEGEWAISPEAVAQILGVGQVEMWRAVHEVRNRICFSEAIDGWTQDTVGDLVTTLEQLTGSNPEDEMAAAGLFMPFRLGIELTGDFLDRGRRFSAAHEIRGEELEAMLRHTGRVRAAIGIYLEEYADIGGLIDGCAESFRTLYDMPAIGASTAARHLRLMIARHVLDRRAVFAGLEERLRAAAQTMGFVDPDDRSRARASSAPSGAPAPRFAWARKVMGFAGGELSAEELRSRYRQLMMRYHPDADPTGLERCKDVNVAYSLLISEFAAAG